MQTEVNGYLMFVECNQAVCCWFGAACHEKKESLSISVFKYPRVAMFIWKANIYCTHLYEPCLHTGVHTNTHTQAVQSKEF